MRHRWVSENTALERGVDEMKHPQFAQLDSIRFVSSTLKRLNHSETPALESLTIGKNGIEKPLELENPFIVPPYITRNLDGDLFTGISLGSCLSGINMNLHGKMSKDQKEIHKIHSPPVLYDLCTCRKVPDASLLMMSDCLWLELGPPEGDTGRNSSKEWGEYPELEGSKDLIHFVSMLKETRDIPIIISIRAIDLVNDVDNVLVTEADAIHIRCGFDDDDHNGPSFFGFTGEPVTTAIQMVEHMDIFKSREKGVKFLLSGPFRNAADIIKLAALGVDGFGIDSLLRRKILPNENTVERKLDWASIGETVQISIKSLRDEIISYLDTLNLKSLEQLDRSMLVVDSYHTAALTGLPLAGYGREIPFWRH